VFWCFVFYKPSTPSGLVSWLGGISLFFFPLLLVQKWSKNQGREKIAIAGRNLQFRPNNSNNLQIRKSISPTTANIPTTSP